MPCCQDDRVLCRTAVLACVHRLFQYSFPLPAMGRGLSLPNWSVERIHLLKRMTEELRAIQMLETRTMHQPSELKLNFARGALHCITSRRELSVGSPDIKRGVECRLWRLQFLDVGIDCGKTISGRIARGASLVFDTHLGSLRQDDG